MIERSHLRLAFWLTVLLVAYTAIAWTITDYETCIGGGSVVAGHEVQSFPVVCK